MGFSEGCKVVVEQVDDENWLVRYPFTYRARDQVFEIEDGTPTDFASVPRAFVWFLPRYGRYTKAAIVHDTLWRRHAAEGRISWVDADGIFRRAMRELEVPFLRRWIMWSAVRWAALLKPGGREGWAREAPRVLLLTAVAAPVLVPPALLILLALVQIFVLEQVTWLGLAAGRQVKRLFGREPEKELNKPSLDLRAT